MPEKFLGVKGGINLTNPFTAASDATLVECDNMQNQTPGVVQSRRGVVVASATLPNFLTALRNTVVSGDDFFSHRDGNVLAYGDGFAWTNVGNGSLENADLKRRMRVNAFGDQHYFTSDNGVKTSEPDYAYLQFAGMCMGINPDYNMPTPFSVGTTMPTATDGAWRVCFVRRRLDGSEVRGSPSGRMIYRNGTGVTQDPIIRVTLGKQANTDSVDFLDDETWSIELYRSKFRPFINGLPDDEMRLVFVQPLDVGMVAAGFVDITDTTPDSVWGRGPLLYTNPNSGEVGPVSPTGQPTRGILLKNETPPLCRDVVSWKGRQWFAECETRAAVVIQMQSVPTVAGQQLLIDGVTYTTTLAFPPLVDEFSVNPFPGDLSRNLQATALSLVSAINNSPNNTTIWANYVGETANAPGKILLQARTFGYTFAMDDTFVPFPAVACFNPPLITLGTIAGEIQPNALYYSKAEQAEAVAPVSFFKVGGPSASLLRIVPLRDYLYCFTSEGIFRVSGDDENTFAVQLHDGDFECIARETVVTGNDDRIYAWGDQGIASVDDGGVRYLSTPIDSVVRFFQTRYGPDEIMRDWFAVASPVWQWVAFWFSSTAGSRNAYVWNIPSQTWTTFSFRQLPGSSDDGRKHVACTQANNGRTVYGKRAATSSIFFEQILFGDAYWTDTADDAVSGGIIHTLTWHPIQEAPPVMCHWREVHAHGQLNTLLPDAWPAALPVQMTTGTGTTVVDNPVPYNVAQQGQIWAINARAIVGVEARRAIRFSPGIITPGTDTAVSLPVEGVTVLYEPYSTRAGK